MPVGSFSGGLRLMIIEGLQQLIEGRCRFPEWLFANFGPQCVCPESLARLYAVQRRPALGGQRQQFRPLMCGIAGVGDIGLFFQRVGDTLDSLTRKAEDPSRIRDGQVPVFGRSEHLPSGAALSRWFGKRIARRGNPACKAQYGESELGKSIALAGPGIFHIDNLLSCVT